jgi:hypothetical protein
VISLQTDFIILAQKIANQEVSQIAQNTIIQIGVPLPSISQTL